MFYSPVFKFCFTAMNFNLNTCEMEYIKDRKIKKEDIRQLLEWVEKQSHMPRVTEYMFIQFYQVCDYSLQKTKQLTEKYYKYKHFVPKLFAENEFSQSYCTCYFWNNIYCFCLPNTTPEGYRLIYTGLKNYEITKFNHEVPLKLSLKVLLTIIMEQGICSGYIFIHDIKGYNFNHIAGMNTSLFKQFLYFSQEIIPLKVKSIYVINGHNILHLVKAIVKPFLKKEVMDMVHIKSNVKDFFDCVHKSFIPRDLGGTSPFSRDDLNELTKAKVNELSFAVNEELHLKTNENKRIRRERNEDTASFKKLEID